MHKQAKCLIQMWINQLPVVKFHINDDFVYCESNLLNHKKTMLCYDCTIYIEGAYIAYKYMYTVH